MKRRAVGSSAVPGSQARGALPLSALTTAPGFPDRSLPMRYARTRPSSRIARPQPASATEGRRTFRRDVTGLCPARPGTPRRWATVTTCARFAASSSAEPNVPGSHRRASPTWCSPSASLPPTPCATRTAAEHYRSGRPGKSSSARWPTLATSPIRSPGTGPRPMSCWAATASGSSTKCATLSRPEPARQAPPSACTRA